jgi:hypothetical protein
MLQNVISWVTSLAKTIKNIEGQGRGGVGAAIGLLEEWTFIALLPAQRTL